MAPSKYTDPCHHYYCLQCKKGTADIESTMKPHRPSGSNQHFNRSPATDGSKLLPGRLFVRLCDFDNKSAIDKLMRSSEHPFLMSMLNLSQKARQRPESWSMIALLPDIEVSNLEKSESNPKLAMKRLNLYHKMFRLPAQIIQGP